MFRKKILQTLGLALLGAAVLAGPALLAQDAPKKSDAKSLEILEKMIEALGGRKLMESIKDTTISGTMELVSMGMEGAVTLYNKSPDKMRIDVEIMGMTITQAFDGETAWNFNPQTGANEVMADEMAEDFKRDAWGDEYLLYPAKHNIVYTYKGTEKVDDKDMIVLTQTHPDGWEATLYVDPGTYLTYKTKTTGMSPMGVEAEIESFTSDYKKVNGLMVPHSMTTFNDGEEFMTITVTDIKLNTGLEDSLFVMED